LPPPLGDSFGWFAARARPLERRPGPAGRLRRHHQHHEADRPPRPALHAWPRLPSRRAPGAALW